MQYLKIIKEQSDIGFIKSLSHGLWLTIHPMPLIGVGQGWNETVILQADSQQKPKQLLYPFVHQLLLSVEWEWKYVAELTAKAAQFEGHVLALLQPEVSRELK